MPSRGQIAGIIAFVSLVVPWGITYNTRDWGTFTELLWTIGACTIWSGGGNFGSAVTFTNLTQWSHVADAVLNALTLIMVLAGAVILIASRRHAGVGASLVVSGVMISVIDIILDVAIYGFSLEMPIGLILALVAGILGFTGRPLLPRVTVGPEPESSLDRLAKLKELLDAGAITKEEFEEQKKRILQSGEERA